MSDHVHHLPLPLRPRQHRFQPIQLCQVHMGFCTLRCAFVMFGQRYVLNWSEVNVFSATIRRFDPGCRCVYHPLFLNDSYATQSEFADQPSSVSQSRHISAQASRIHCCSWVAKFMWLQGSPS